MEKPDSCLDRRLLLEKETEDTKQIPQKQNSDDAPAVMMNGVTENGKSTRTPKLLFSDEVQVKIETEPVPSNNQAMERPHIRPVIDVDEARIRAEKVVAAVFAEAKEVAEAAAMAEAKAKSKENISDSEESHNDSNIKDEVDTEMVCLEDTKHRKYSSSEDSSEDSSGAYSPSSSSSGEDTTKGTKPGLVHKLQALVEERDTPNEDANTELSAKSEIINKVQDHSSENQIIKDASKSTKSESKEKEEEEEIDIDLNDPEVGKVAAKLQTGFFSKFGRKTTPPTAAKPTQSQTLDKGKEPNPANTEQSGVLSSITSFMSSPKIGSSETPPKALPSEKKPDVPTSKTDLVETTVAEPQMKNVEKLDATKHGTCVDKENNKKEDEEEIDIDLNDPEVKPLAAKS